MSCLSALGILDAHANGNANKHPDMHPDKNSPASTPSPAIPLASTHLYTGAHKHPDT